jgi:imidazolonepropionase-like amidohydrolase
MSRIIFYGGTVYDGTMAEPASGDLVVEDGRIVEVGVGLDGDEGVDCTGRWISAGFFDTHVHVMVNQPDLPTNLATPFSLPFYHAAANLKKTLDIGITSVRDASGADLGVKSAVEQGIIPGPRMQVSIGMLSQTGGHGDSWQVSGGGGAPLFPTHPGRPSTVVDGPDDVRRKVRELVRMGADVIKIATSGGVLSPNDDPRHAHFRDDEIRVAVEEATAAGIYVMAHAQATEGIKAAVRCGVRSIEHGIYLDDEAVELMIRHGCWLVPTLHAPRSVIRAFEAGVSFPPQVIEKTHMVMEVHRESVRHAHDAGVRIAMGTDCGVGPHGTNLDELPLMMDAGLTAIEALHATTGSAAELLGVADERGTVAPGRLADLVVLDGSPTDLMGLADRVHSVYQSGRLVSSGAV